MKEIRTPATTVERLPLYYRCLQKLSEQQVEVISSKDLGNMLGIPSTQVRKDLSYYGEFGRRGVGYEVSVLLKNLEKILGLDNDWEIVLIGAGNLGQALVNYGNFRNLGLEINYALDVDQGKIGNHLGDVKIHSVSELDDLVQEKDIRIAIVAVPADSAQQIANKLVANGVEAIWNFAPTRLEVPEEIEVRNEDLSIGLISLTYHLSE
ncbi:AT-rich DNA-binding protein [Halobacteroides halobius DSM 5150]|uniref:Redox-sensing transcriptional repressor Rex n=1 Tax=Halobacteroides halobius (strain ATCC 35273 / DSM 5150 / MD-1) TaxID=748449 RepID=L0KD24_HALHC|nr:redox-sensing transcriptional repressor Rex [Halobacteroides halobius]AGB42445.1 AT-rich DNA-binding protein [Halobacteroides halobius DSM 5150]